MVAFNLKLQETIQIKKHNFCENVFHILFLLTGACLFIGIITVTPGGMIAIGVPLAIPMIILCFILIVSLCFYVPECIKISKRSIKNRSL